MKIKFLNELLFLKSLKNAIKTNALNVNWLLETLNSNRESISFIKKHQDLILSSLPKSEEKAFIKFCIDELGELLPCIFNLYSLLSLIKVLLEIKQPCEVINLISKNNFEISKKAGVNLFMIFNDCKNHTPEIDEFLQELIFKHSNQYLSAYASKLIKFNKNKGTTIISLLSQIIEAVFLHESLSWLDIKYLTPRPTFNNVIQIGDKIIKLGTRACTNIPDDERILTPIIRINLNDLDSELEGIIELTERVETISYLPNEEIYQMYKELRKRNIICTDLKTSNIGILLKDNVSHWNNKYLQSFLICKNKDKRILPAGNWVILDCDHIYYADDPNIHWCYESKKYEERYQKEKYEVQRIKCQK